MRAEEQIVIDNITLENGIKVSMFAYELKSIKKGLQNAEEEIKINAINWHKSLFKLISCHSFDCSLTCKIQNPGSVGGKRLPMRILFVFCIAYNEALDFDKEILAFINELSILFIPEKSSKAQAYIFSAVSDIDVLKSLQVVHDDCQMFEYRRKPVFYSSDTKSIGFNNEPSIKEEIESVPQFYIPDILGITCILQNLTEREHFIEISLILSPINIPYEVINNFKHKLDTSVLNAKHFTKVEKAHYNKHIEMVFDDNTLLFCFKVELTASNLLRIGQPIHNRIADTFFGNIQNTVVGLKEPGNCFFSGSMTFEEMIPYVYPEELVIFSFRLPMSIYDDFIWFTHQTNIFNYLPSELPAKGVLLGVKKMFSHEKEIRISSSDLSTHMYILGQTGVGKTTLMKTMIMNQIDDGEGVCVVDPHGDLIESVYSKIPANRMQDVIYFDPTKSNNIHINIIETHPNFPEQRSFIFNELFKLFDELYDMKQVAGPMFELYFKNALFLLIEFRHSLKQMTDFFLNKSFRKYLIDNSSQTEIIDFFESVQGLTGEISFENIAPYIYSKINRFTMDDFIGPVINQERSTIDFREMIDSRKIFLVRLPKGRLGSEGAKFIGTVIFNRLIMAAYTRDNIRKEDRVPFNLYVDEFQNFTSTDLLTALSESRKYNLKLILANQTLWQLDNKTTGIILGNVGTQIFFRPGIMDIQSLLPYFSKHISDTELLDLPNYNAIGRLMNNNAPLKPFVFETKV